MVKRDSRTYKPSVGDRVRVLWGLDYVEGIVRELYGPPGHPLAIVAVSLSSGEDEEGLGEHTVSLPLSALEPLAGDGALKSAGAQRRR